MKQKIFICLMVLTPLIVFLSHPLFGQTQKVTGIVRSAQDNEPVPGANVIAVSDDHNIGTSTDLNGSFELNVPAEVTTLRVMFVGMVAKDVPIQGRSHIEVLLEEESLAIDELVVVGYSVQRKESLTTSISEVGGEDLTRVSDSNLEKLIQGNAPGVLVSSSRGAPGSAASITIRGASSINAGTQPLYVIDGVPVVSGTTGSAQSYSILSSLNSNDIESVTILKDAGATAIYGSRAANGVVIIQTKSGEQGATNVNVAYERGYSSVSNDGIQMMNADELLMIKREAVENSFRMTGESNFDWTDPNSQYYLPDDLASTNTNWWDEVTRIGRLEDLNVSVSGGDKNNKFYMSGGYHNNEGAIMNYDFSRYTGTANVDHVSNNGKLKAGAKAMGSMSRQSFVYDASGGVLPYENPVFAAMALPPFLSPFNPDGSVNQDMGGAHANFNPFVVEKYQDKYQNYTKALASSYVSYKFLEMFELKSTLGFDYGLTKNYDFEDPRADIYAGSEGAVWESHGNRTAIVSTNQLNFNKIFNEVHSVSAIAGQEVQRDNYSYISGGGKGGSHDLPYLTTLVSEDQYISGHPSELHRLSFFTFATYSYSSKYYFQVSARRDGASSFGRENQWANFGSVSGSWRISNEDFFDVSQIDDLRLRTSYGTTGNSDIDWYQWQGTYFVPTYDGKSGLLPSTIENPNLKWEKTASLDIAIDFAAFNNRISGTLEYYNNKTTDMLLSRELSLTSGFESVMTNVGSLRNTGLEFAVNTVNFDGEFRWATGFNISFPSSEILELDGESEYVGSAMYQHRIGGDYVEYWMYKYAGVNPGDGMPMWYDDNGNITFDYGQAGRYKAGSPEPDFFGAITNNLSWRGISLDFMFYFMYGNDVIFSERKYSEHDQNQWGQNANVNQLRRWQNPGDITDTPKPLVKSATQAYDWACSRWVDDGSYIRLKYVTLSYTLPKSLTQRLNLGQVTIKAQGNNLWTLAKVNGLDVERDSWGRGTYTYPATQNISFGIDLSF